MDLTSCQNQDILCIVGSVVECSPATRAARVRFPDDAIFSVLSETSLLERQTAGDSVSKGAGPYNGEGHLNDSPNNHVD